MVSGTALPGVARVDLRRMFLGWRRLVDMRVPILSNRLCSESVHPCSLVLRTSVAVSAFAVLAEMRDLTAVAC